jgi:hypothetical protein
MYEEKNWPPARSSSNGIWDLVSLRLGPAMVEDGGITRG